MPSNSWSYFYWMLNLLRNRSHCTKFWLIGSYKTSNFKSKQSLYAIRILRSHCLLGGCLFDVVHVRSTTVGRMLHCSPVWWGFTEAEERGALEEIIRKLVRLWFLRLSAPTLRFFATKPTPISLPVFWTILVMYCISCYSRLDRRLGSLAIPWAPDLITESSLSRNLASY